jgi:hypothetical protein
MLLLSALIIQVIPNLSVNKPKYESQNVSAIGIAILPFSDNPLNKLSASSCVSTWIDAVK